MSKRSRQKSSSSSTPIDLAGQNTTDSPVSKRRITDLSEQRSSSRLNSASSSSTISSLQSLIYDNANRSGKIIQMTLKNFMCHSNLLVVFNNRINLLVGNNGSGKSAILTAMIIGFGSKSAATNRCQNMRQLIKNGQNSASIEIQLYNHRSDGYEFDKYGDKIIVLRSFTAGGGSTYKIKNSQGQTLSSSREDLMRILMYLNIQVDNPVCVLNQDASRSFLRESDPKKRYQLFLKATQIETIMEKLQECYVHFKSAKVQLDYHRKRSVLMKKTVEDLYERLERVRSVATITQKVAALKLEQSWLYLIDQEIFSDEIKKSLTEFEQKYEKLKVTCSSKDAMQQQIRENIEIFQAEKELLTQDMIREEVRYTEQRNSLAEKKAVQQQMQQNVEKLLNKRKRLETDIAQLNTDIAERGQAGSNAVQIQREKDEISKQNLTKEFSDKSAMSANAARDISMMINTKHELKANFNGLREERQNLLRGADKLTEQIRRCDVSTKDTLLVYGDYMPRLRASIDALYKKGAFSQMPRGPIGNYINITDEHWKIPIEGIVKNVLQNFLVADSKDRRVLQELIRKDYPQHSRHAVISCKFQHTVYNVSRGRVQPVANSRLAMDLIQCDDPVVMNCLIDQCKVERILLVENEMQAVKLTAEEENVPQNLLRVVLKNPLSDFYPAPNYRSYSNPQRYAKFLQVNMDQRKRDLIDELKSYENRKTNIENQLAAAQDKLTKISKTLSEKTEQKDKHEMDLQGIKSQLADLNAVEYPDGNEMEVLNKELDQLTRTFEETVESCVIEGERVKDHANLLAEKDGELNEIKKLVEAKEMEMRELQFKHDQKHRKITELLVNAEHSAAQLKTMETELRQLKKEYNDALDKLDRLLKTAQNRGERMVPRHTHEQITAKLSKNERLIRAVPTAENIEMLEIKYNNKSKEYEQLQEMIDALVETLTLLHKSRRTRLERLNHLKQHMSLRVKSRFNEILKLRNYTGDITIDFDNLRLELSVVPRDKDVENAVSNASGLSGGERSYSTVAFLLSLWSCVDFPFYFLDEYDVFTDQINRHYITKLLLSEADKKIHRQYTFLTPQDMSDITGTENLSVHRLADPER